ncbi:alpha/beta hydrolase [Diaminobutyricimonas sp. TR449]|uniref:alpha/beta hydrolase n=1 Tax=Diaminobutyricimonas sp. TR449 TaxID=2708076 RepID=UPI001423DEFF|nr:alpha/beta hydrolase [Diaminobutyricimonas sp. TR449]
MNHLKSLAIGVLTLLALTGCVSAPPSTTSTPTGEQVAAELQPFYNQVLQWESCGDGLQCTTAKAPMDWKNPGDAEIELALVRHPATGDRLGSLLVNPGGPGASGYDFIMDSVDFATSEKLQSRYDIVGFDPRGVNKSSAVDCYDQPAELDEAIYGVSDLPVGTDAWIEDIKASAAEFAQACLEHTGELLEHVDTVSAARDLDLLRAVLGDSDLNYLGYSYGTLLGATYADLYPENTGRMVFDGAVDPATSELDVTATQAKGFEDAMRAFLADCLGADDCPFQGTVDQSMELIDVLLDSLNESPLRHTDGRMLSGNTMFTAIILPLYNVGNWPYLKILFDEVLSGETTTAFLLADTYYDRAADGTYQSNQTEAFLSINCLDYQAEYSNETLHENAAKLAEIAPVFGPRMSYGVSCADWPFESERERTAIAAEGSSDLLVVGTTGDPATPYQWAVNMADQLENGHLVTYNGEGHTAYNKSNDCVQNAVEGYLIDGTVPEADPNC